MKTVWSCLTCLAMLAPLAASAGEERRITLEASAAFTPHSAVGLLLTTEGLQQVLDASLTERGEQRYQVSFKIDPEKVDPAAAVSALLLGEKGESAYADVRGLSMAEALPDVDFCPLQESPDQSSFSIYEKLIKVRTDRRAVAKQLFEQEFTAEWRDNIAAYSHGFGLDSEPALDADLPPLVLAERLARLQNAFEDYAASRRRE